MSLLDIGRIKRVVTLDEKVYKEIRDDKEALKQAVVIVLLAAFIGSIWSIIFTLGLGLILVILTPVILAIWTVILHVIAKILGGKASFKGYMNTIFFGYTPVALGIIPFVGSFVGGIWVLACQVIATKSAHELSLVKAIIVVLIPIIIIGISILVIGVILWQIGIFSAPGY